MLSYSPGIYAILLFGPFWHLFSLSISFSRQSFDLQSFPFRNSFHFKWEKKKSYKKPESTAGNSEISSWNVFLKFLFLFHSFILINFMVLHLIRIRFSIKFSKLNISHTKWLAVLPVWWWCVHCKRTRDHIIAINFKRKFISSNEVLISQNNFYLFRRDSLSPDPRIILLSSENKKKK